MEEDHESQCTNYPNRYYTSYDQCDHSFILRKLSEEFGPEFVPIWATDDKSKVTSLMKINQSRVAMDQYYALTNGLYQSPCQKPCRTTQTTTKLSTMLNVECPAIFVLIREQMKVTITSLVPFSLTTFLSQPWGLVGAVAGPWHGPAGEALHQWGQRFSEMVHQSWVGGDITYLFVFVLQVKWVRSAFS